MCVIGEGVLSCNLIKLNRDRKAEAFGLSLEPILTIGLALKRSPTDWQITSQFFNGSIRSPNSNI